MHISPEAIAAIEVLRAEVQPEATTHAEDRAGWTAFALADPPPPGTLVTGISLGGVAAEMIRHPESPGQGLFVLLHGGGYVSGNCITHRKLAAHISLASGMEVLVPDYRLAPEHPAPAAIDDVQAVWLALLDAGTASRNVVIGGDSAGGGLTAALLVRLRDGSLPLPAAAVLMSPWTDILARGGSYAANRTADPSINAGRLRECGREYTGSGDPLDPLISPIEADLSGLPPLLIQVGAIEAMLDDTLVFADRARAAGVDVTCEVWPGMWHVWQAAAPGVPEANDALARIGAFARARAAA